MRITNDKGASIKENITSSIIDIFQNHIGIENAISSEDLFLKVTGIRADSIDYYERAYKWNLIKRVLGVLRKNGTLFVITGTSYHYVLNSSEELVSYKNRVDATIKGLHNIKYKAELWIDSENLKNLKHKAKELQENKEKKVLKVVTSK